MYNEEYKEEFIQHLKTKETTQKAYRTAFNTVEKIEKEFGMDLYDMNKAQIIESIKQFKTKTAAKPAISRLRKYLEYSYLLGKSPVNILDKDMLSTDTIIHQLGEDVGEIYYLSDEQYTKYKNQLLSSENGIYITSIFAAVYEGIAGKGFENLANLRLQNIDIEDLTVHLYDGRCVQVSKELVSLLVKCASVDVLRDARKAQGFNYYLYHDSIWKEVRLVNNKSRKFTNAFVNHIKKILDDENMNPKCVERSGIFNRVVTYAKGHDLDIRSDMEEKYKSIISKGSIQNRFSPTGINEKYQNAMAQSRISLTFIEFKSIYMDWIKYI